MSTRNILFLFWLGEIVRPSSRMQEPVHAKEKLYLDTLAKIQKKRRSSVNKMKPPLPRDMKQKRTGSSDFSLGKSFSIPRVQIFLR